MVEPLTERAGREIGPLYEGMARGTAELCARYSDQELALLLDFITRSHPLNQAETAKLRAATPGRKPRWVGVDGRENE